MVDPDDALQPRAGMSGVAPAGAAPAWFASEYRRAHPSLWQLAAGLSGDRNDANDILPQAVLTALRRDSDFRPGTHFRACSIALACRKERP